MKAIVFGATGFIGSHVVEALAAAQHRVTAVVRRGSDTRFLNTLNIRTRELDFDDARALPLAIEGHEIVYNCIADVRANKSLEVYRHTNVYMTRWIAEAAARVDVARLIQLSTVLAYGSALPAHAVNEDFNCAPRLPLEIAMAERERVIHEVVAATDLSAVMLRPAATIGARDKVFARLYREHACNRFSYVGDGARPVSRIDARDVGRAMVWLGQMPRLKYHTYLVRGFEASTLDIKHALDCARGVIVPARSLSPRTARAVGQVFDWLMPETREPSLTRQAAEWAGANQLFDDLRLRKTGFAPRHRFADTITYAIGDVEARGVKSDAVPNAVTSLDAHTIGDSQATN